MGVVFLLLLLLPLLLFSGTLALVEPGFSEEYERDYNIFNPASRYAHDNPLSPAQIYASENLFNPANRYNPTTPFEPLNGSR
ncbi:MAG TPA: hypothetical protein VK901_06985 [Nitrospiraceae bacterium]|nr:hypothetical protein [Nitrospiraceae bacterium]